MPTIDLKNCTFNIPYFHDSEDRIENLHFLVDYLTHHFDTNIIIKEVGKVAVLSGMPWLSGCEYVYEYSDNPIFHRTKVLNELCRMSKTPVIVNQDTDVIVPVSAYILARDLIVDQNMDVVYPYDGKFMECERDKIGVLRENYDFSSVKGGDLNCLNPNSTGGIIFERREKFIEIGMNNENFNGWSLEDWCFVDRIKKLNLNIRRTGNYLIHINHWRGANSSEKHPHYQQNLNEYYKVTNMPKDQLIDYISTWTWSK